MTVHRGLARIAVRAAEWGMAALLFATLTALSWGRWAPFLVGVAASAVFAAITIRMAHTRIVSDSNGIAVHTLYGRAFYQWEDITLIGVLHSKIEGDLLKVYIPAARLTDGRYIQLTPAGCYRRAKAATIGAQLDAQRRDHLEAGRDSSEPASPPNHPWGTK